MIGFFFFFLQAVYQWCLDSKVALTYTVNKKAIFHPQRGPLLFFINGGILIKVTEPRGSIKPLLYRVLILCDRGQKKHFFLSLTMAFSQRNVFKVSLPNWLRTIWCKFIMNVDTIFFSINSSAIHSLVSIFDEIFRLLSVTLFQIWFDVKAFWLYISFKM